MEYHSENRHVIEIARIHTTCKSSCSLSGLLK